MGELLQPPQVCIFHPGAAQADSGYMALGIARHGATEVSDPLGVFSSN